MLKKYAKTSLLLLILSLVTFQTAYAASTIYEQSGDVYSSSLQVSSEGSSYTIDLQPYAVAKAEWGTYTDSTFETSKTFKIIDAVSLGAEYISKQDFNCKGTYYKIVYFNSSGTQIGTLKFLSGDDITGSKCGSTDASGGSGTGTDCPGCEMFDCPGWTEYMGKVDGIIAKIPPPPNWNNVAEIFRDTIAPRIKHDLQDVLGNAPEAPSPPAAPGIPAQPSNLDDKGISEPTGNEAPGLGNSTFDENDIKNGAPVIQERQDPIGGFTINDPLGGLPSQAEFEANQPTPETGEAPNPPEQNIPVPTDPTELPNTAPTPGGTSGGSETAPIPSDNGTAPIPDPTNETAPISVQP